MNGNKCYKNYNKILNRLWIYYLLQERIRYINKKKESSFKKGFN